MDESVLATLLASVARTARPQAQPTPQQLPTSQTLDAQLINSSDFRMYCFKILPCTRRYGHDWTACPFCHPGEKATRRCPQKHNYMPLACPDIKKTGECPRRHACTYAHNVFEFWCHPLRFRTQMCSYGSDCKRSICFFAHSYSELRVVDQSLLQELERQMDLLGEGAGFGFPPSNRGRSPRDEMMQFTPREMRRTADELQSLTLLPTKSTGEAGGDPASDTAALCSAPDGSTQHDDAPASTNPPQDHAGPGAPGPDTVPPSAPSSCADSASNASVSHSSVSAAADTTSGGMEPSLAALQLLQLQAMAQQRQQVAAQPAPVPVDRSFASDNLTAAAVLLGVDVSYLAQALQATPPPTARPQPPPTNSAAVLQALVKQFMGTPASPAAPATPASPAGLPNWLPNNLSMSPAAVASMLMEASNQNHACNSPAAGGNRGFGGPQVSPMSGLGSALPSLRANEDQMAATLKLVAEIAANARKPATAAPAPPAQSDPMQAVIQQLQEHLSGRLPGTSSMQIPANPPEQHAGGADMSSALASLQLSLDYDRLGKLMESLAPGNVNPVGPMTMQGPPAHAANGAAEAGQDMQAAIVSMLSQMSNESGGASAAQDVVQGGKNSHSYYGANNSLNLHVGSPVNLASQSSLGTGSAFGNPNAAALAVAAMQQANSASKASAAAAHQFNAFAQGSLFNHMPSGNSMGAKAGGGAVGGTTGNSTSPVDVLSMQSAHSNHADSGTASSAGSDGSGSPRQGSHGDRSSSERITHALSNRDGEESEGVEAADLAAHPELVGAHRLLGHLSELVGEGPDRHSMFSLRSCNSLRVGAASFIPSHDNSPRRPLVGSVSSPLGAFDFMAGGTPFCVQPASNNGAGESGMHQAGGPPHYGACGMGPASPCAAVALLTPAGTGSFNAHDFPAEL